MEQLTRPLVLTIFGITGDLAQRYILPALYELAAVHVLPEQLRIVGVSRRDITKDEVYGQLQEFVKSEGFDEGVKQRLLEATEMRQMDLESAADYTTLLEHLHEVEREFGGDVSRLYYLSIPAQSFAGVVHLLGQTGHNEPSHEGAQLPRLLIEKPFGYDLASAEELINAVKEHFSEAQAYRIDHYLAKETAQNILTFRFKNPLFDAVWDNQHIESIEIAAREQLDIEGRANFYEQTGALRDLIQSHLMQLLAITTMQKPAAMDSDSIHAAKLELLKLVEPADPAQAVRGQYEGYRTEVEHPESPVETFARVRLNIGGKWAGVPVTLETGKALQAKRTEITVCFKPTEDDLRNKLLFRIQPAEGITLQLQAKRPGIDNTTETVDMDFDYVDSFDERQPGAYERVIVDAIRGDQTLFASSAEVLASWHIIAPVLQKWSESGEDLLTYAKGTPGPR